MGQAYDIIGDIHGYSKTLEALLQRLDYKKSDGVYRHAQRKVIFMGDLIDRGPEQKEVVAIVRRMVEAGEAICVMGNHEFNAIAYYTEHPNNSGKHLREHNNKNKDQHKEFLAAYENTQDEYDDVIAWFKSLPLWVDLGELRIVHACWDVELMGILELQLGQNKTLTDDLLIKASLKNSAEYQAVEALLKGKEKKLPDGKSFRDKDGHERHEIRVKWHDNFRNYRDAFLGPESQRTHVPDHPIDGDYLIEYSHKNPPVFIGHYWFDNEKPERLSANIACVDYSVAKDGGKLVAYRWDGEQIINNGKFIYVERLER